MEHESFQQNMPGVDLRFLLADLLDMARRLLWLGVALVLLFGAVFGLGAYCRYIPQYRAEASFTVTVTSPLSSGAWAYDAAAAKQMVKTLPHIITSGALDHLVMERLDVELLPQVSVTVLDSTNIFTLAVTDKDPSLAYNTLCAYMELYPEVAKFVVGPTRMDLLSQSGVPAEPHNRADVLGGVMLGALAGGVLWMAVLLFQAMTWTAIHNEEELKRLTGLHCMGTIPFCKPKRRRPDSWPMLSEAAGRSGFSESVRLLCIRVKREMDWRQHKVLLVSSAIPGEGTTTVAVNLALGLAQMGERTLLVDLDFRNPSVSRIFGHEAVSDIRDVLNGKVQPRDCVERLWGSGLFGALAGTAAGTAEDFDGEGLRQLICQAREDFDYVILDTPPCAMWADAAEAAWLADCGLMVIGQSFSSCDRILEGTQLLSGGGLPLLGGVLNRDRCHVLRGDCGRGCSCGYGSGERDGKDIQMAGLLGLMKQRVTTYRDPEEANAGVSSAEGVSDVAWKDRDDG